MVDEMVGGMSRSRAKATASLISLLLAASLGAAGLSAGPTPSAAQSLFQPPRSDADGEYGEGLAPFEADGPLIAVVSTGSQQVRVFDRNGVVAAARVSTGRKGYETPEGVFSIIERKVEHNSNLYDDASMPFMQRITWSGVALHEGVVPGYRASHGCIRLPNGFAERLFRTTKLSTRVVIVPHDGVPLPLSHPVLFQPGPPPQVAVAAVQSMAPSQPEIEPGAANASPMKLGGALSAPGLEPQASPEIPASSLPAPAPSAAELKARRLAAEQRLAAATKAANEARLKARSRLVEQGQAERALRQATFLANRAEGRAQRLAPVSTVTEPGSDETSQMAAHLEALIEQAQLRGREDAARETVAEKLAAAQAVLEQIKKLEAERQAAQNETRSLARRLSPVTIFVSRQTGRVYVRQATREIMDVAVPIRDVDRSIGTHVFTALDADDASDNVKWMALTIAGPAGAESAETQPAEKRRRRESRKPEAPTTASRDPLHEARLALDRVELPQEVLARVMPALQPGSTLIISDLGPSIETGPGTDVVVQTKGEEQAAKNIASFQARKRAESAAAAFYSPSYRRRDNDFVGSRYWSRW